MPSRRRIAAQRFESAHVKVSADRRSPRRIRRYSASAAASAAAACRASSPLLVARLKTVAVPAASAGGTRGKRGTGGTSGTRRGFTLLEAPLEAQPEGEARTKDEVRVLSERIDQNVEGRCVGRRAAAADHPSVEERQRVV
jgi:hypothetical protein